MPGTAALGSTLIDELVPVVDDLRGLYASMGVLPVRAYVVRRVWSGARRGEGTLSLTSITEITPTPVVDARPRDTLIAAGRREMGDVTLTEVSLTYTQAELTGGALAANAECFWRLVGVGGQLQSARDYVVRDAPMVDRTKHLGWRVELKQATFHPDPEA